MGNTVKKLFFIALFVSIMVFESKMIELNAAQNTDDFLYETGMPQEVINQLTESQKELIRESVNSDASFFSYDSKEFIVNEDGKLMLTATIPDSDLTLSFVAYQGYLDTKEVYVIFPSFIWKKDVSIRNDSFSFILAEGWEVVVDNDDYQYYNLRVHGTLLDGTTDSCDIEPQTLLFNGQSYKMSDITAITKYEGNAVFYAEKKSTSASHKAIVQYVHDGSPACDISYGLSFGIFSISVTSNSDKLSTKNAYFSF